MTTLIRRLRFLSGVFLMVPMVGCDRGDSPSGARTQPTPVPSISATSAQKHFELASGSTATFLIEAPLEKIKGRSTKLRGNLVVDPANLKASAGHIEVDLADLRTETFEEPEKNKAQTEHAQNWFEIGSDVEAERREGNRRALFTIKTMDDATPVRLVSAEVMNGDRTVTVRATGDLWIHGISSRKTVNLTVTFTGPPEAPTSLHLVTSEPLRVSLKEHEVKPRDLAGKFLAGALEKIGQKIDDTVQVSLDLTAKPK